MVRASAVTGNASVGVHVVPSQSCYTECNVQRSAKRLVRGCDKFVTALAYLFGLALPGSCLARFAYFLADLCTEMQEITWARLRESSMHQGASHAT